MRSGIRTNVLLVAIAPALLIALLLLIYLTNTRIRDLEQALTDRGQAIANQLAPGYALAMSTGRLDALSVLARTVLDEPDVRQIVVYDSGSEPIGVLRRQGTEVKTSSPSDLVVSRAPIPRGEAMPHPSADAPNSDASSQGATRSPASIGEVEVTLSRAATVERQHQVIATGLGMTLVCLILATALGTRIGRNVTEPILRMEAVLQRIRQGDLDVRVVETSRGHLGNLERGINAMAKSLRESHENLREQVDQATADLRGAMRALEIKNAELEVARKRALSASRVKSEFLANVSHEIRTPLNGVLGFIELLEQTPLDQTQRNYVETVSSCAENLLGLVNDILDLSKIEAGKLELRFNGFDVRETVENAVLVFAANAQRKGLRFSLDIDSGVAARLHGDASRISQIVSNLVSNAIKFTEAGAVEVEVTASPRPGGKTLLKLFVRDTGIGIALGKQGQLFNAFSQLDSSFTRRHTGTGLGLAISKRLTDLMGGTIAVESRVGKGTTFRLALPLAESEDEVQALAPAHFGACSALLITQDTVLAQALKHLLDNAAVNSRTIDNPSALENAITADEGSEPVCAVIVDADMEASKLDEVLETVAALDSGQSPRLILLGTAQLRNFERRLEDKNLSAHSLAKPPRSASLLRALHSNSPPEKVTTSQGQLHPFQRRVAEFPDKRESKPASVAAKGSNPRHVLLADDNPVNRRLAAIFLAQIGLSIDEVENGREAVDACRSAQYDLVLMDVHMPVMDGIEATRQIRALQNNSNASIPIVALTADALHEERERFLRSGMDDHIAKPITLQALRNLIELWGDKEAAHG